MPPDASSRSRTYLPKIWGNTRLSHATAVLAVLLAGGCRTVPGPIREHPIRAHFLAQCTPEKTTPFRLDLSALGDFDPTGETFESFDDPRVSNRPLVVPGSTTAVTLDATAGGTTFLGLGTRDPSGAIDVALLPVSDACTLTDGVDGYPTGADGAGEALGISGDGRHLLVMGGEGAGATSALTVNLTTGEANGVKGDGPRAARVSAVITPFGDKLLVSGGIAPDTRGALGSADVFDPVTASFEPRIDLERPRASHGATVLASGETLLAGGVDGQGHAIRRLETVSPSSRTYRVAGLAELAFGRISPTVLTLSDGRVLVAGGIDPDDAALPVDTLEWLTADAANPDGTLSLDPPTQRRAFVPMPGGSVLVAGGCVGVGSACAPSNQVLWITRDGVATELPQLDAPSNHPVLIPGSEGRPLLVATGAGATRTLRVFDPFTGRFVDDDSLPDAPPAATVFARADRGLFTWLDTDGGHGVVRAARHGTRNEWSPDVSTLLSEDLSGVSLDRAPQSNYDAATHAVHLDGGARLVLTDTTYADLHLSVTVDGSALPVVRLGNRVFGDRACPFPDGTSSDVTVDRAGTTVKLGRGGRRTECPGPEGRVAVSLEGGGTLPTVVGVDVRRAAE